MLILATGSKGTFYGCTALRPLAGTIQWLLEVAPFYCQYCYQNMSVVFNLIATECLLNSLVPLVFLQTQLQGSQPKVHSFVSLCKCLITGSQNNVQLTQAFAHPGIVLDVYISITLWSHSIL